MDKDKEKRLEEFRKANEVAAQHLKTLQGALGGGADLELLQAAGTGVRTLRYTCIKSESVPCVSVEGGASVTRVEGEDAAVLTFIYSCAHAGNIGAAFVTQMPIHVTRTHDDAVRPEKHAAPKGAFTVGSITNGGLTITTYKL